MRLAPGAAAATILALALAVRPAEAAVEIKRAGSAIDLVLIGYAVFQTNLAEDARGFFDSSDELPAEFSNRQVLNLRLDGRLSKALALDARLLHDRENLRDWRWLFRLSGAASHFAFGELDGAFRDTQLTRYDTPYYGLEGRLGLGRLAASAFATSRSASFRVDRLRGTNLSGPYILSASPALEGSERVAIEVRDRRDEERVLRSDAQVRGQDYTIDYPTGTILFDEPIESETFDGNPILIVVEYEHRAVGGADSSPLGGARVELRPSKSVRLGSTVLRGGRDLGGSLGRGGVQGFDQSFALGRWLTLDNELAGPVGDPFDRREGAWRAAASLRPLGGLEISGRFRRVGRDFDTTANPRLDTETDREDWELDATFVASPEHSFRAGYGVKSDNVARDPAVETTRTRTWFAGWEGQPRHWPLLRLRVERRTTGGPGAFGGGSSDLTTWTADAERKLGRIGLLGATAFKAQYRFEDSQEAAVEDSNRRSHHLKLRFDVEPRSGLESFLEVRLTRTDGEGGSAIRSRTHELLAGSRLKLGKALQAGLSLRFRQNVDDIAEEGSSRRTTAIADLRWEPSERFRALVKYERTLLASDGAPDQRTQNLYGQVAFRPVRELTLSVGSKLDDRGAQAGSLGAGLDGEYFASLLWKRGERLTVFGRFEKGISEDRLPPFAATRADRRTALFGASWDWSRSWGSVLELRDERLSGAARAHRRALVAELHRALGKYLRLAAGTELTLEESGDGDRLDRERFYLKLVGRL